MIVSLFEQERKFQVERNFRRKVIFMMTFCDRVAAVSGAVVVDDVVVDDVAAAASVEDVADAFVVVDVVVVVVAGVDAD